MSRLLNPLSYLSAPQSVMREVAPGVWVEVRPVPNHFKPANMRVREKFQNAMGLFRKHVSIVDLDEYLSKVERRAA